MTSEEKSRVLAQINGKDRITAFEAAKWVWRDSDPTLVSALINLMSKGRKPLNRAAAAYALPALRSPKALPGLERAVVNRSESPTVRGYAAEALAHFHRKQSHKALLEGLQDRSKEVRFWCAFALGQMRDPKAISALRRLAETDRRVVRGFWTVAKEAEDALKEIEGSGRRKCIFCVGQKS